MYVRAVIHRCHQKALSGTQRGVGLYTVYSPPLRNKWFTAYTFIKTRSLIICTILPDRTSSQILLNMLSMNTGAMTSSVLIILLGLSCQMVDASLESEMKKILPMCTVIDRYMENTRCFDPENMEANEDRTMFEEECICPVYRSCFVKIIDQISDGNSIVDFATAEKRYICKSQKTLDVEQKKKNEASNHAASG